MTAASSSFNAVDGDGYELQMGRWSRRLAGPFLDFVGTASDERVLDVGCGTGCLAFAIAQRCDMKELRGIDFSPVYVQHASRHNHDPRISFEVGDACAMGFTDVTETTLSIRMEFASLADYWAPYVGTDGPGAEYVATLTDAERSRLQDAVRLAYLDGEADGPRSYAALAWAVKGITAG